MTLTKAAEYCVWSVDEHVRLCSGIYRAAPMRLNPRQSQVKSVYKTHIDAIHFRKTDEKRLHGVDEDGEQKLFTKERVATLKELAAKPDVYERLSSALAPSIYEHEDIKKVCLLFILQFTSDVFLWFWFISIMWVY